MEYRQPATLEEALHLLAAAGSKLQKQQSRLEQQSYKLEQQNSKIEQQNSKIEQQNSKLEQQKLEIENQKNQIRDLQEKLALQLAYRFCSHTEKYFSGQPSLFNEGEISPVPDEDMTAVHDEEIFKEETVSTYKRNRKGRKPLAEELPRKTEVIDIPESEKQCACGHELVKIGEDVSERLQYIPSQIYVLRTVRPKYACRNCEGSGDEDRPVFRQAAAPLSILPKSIAGESLLAAVFTNKYELHLPYYRQEKAFEHRLIGISRQDMSSWQETVYKAAHPLEKLLMAHIKSGKVLHMDETTVQVLHYEKAGNEEEEKDENRDKSYMWLARGGPEETPAVVYRYFKTRSASHVKEFINGFSGFLMTDGYKGYSAALKEHELLYPEETITHACCLAHARRKFNDALKAGKSESAKAALSFIQKIYVKEAELRSISKSDDDFLAGRKKEVQPLFDRFKKWLTDKHEHAVNSGKFGEAVSYTLEYWDLILNYLLSPELTPDNNTAENAVRPFICGRKNWLFSGSEDGARSSCFMYTLIENAKLYKLVPYDYLRCLFERIPYACTDEAEDWKQLLPWNIKLSSFEDKGDWVIN